MEEEIITPEEEVFDYNKLRYILDKDGYIFHASFGGLVVCDLGECTEYIGDIPEGYSTIEEWFEGENDKLNAWKIVDDNLVFDNVRYEQLQARYKAEADDNRTVVYKEIKNITSIVDEDVYEKYMQSSSNLAKISSANDSNKFASKFIYLKANENIKGTIQIKFNNNNFLTNDATSKNESGISFAVNTDRSINMNGTSTDDIEFNIAGTNISIEPVLTFKKNVNYHLSSGGYVLKMFHYDGTDRTEIYSGTGGIINFTDNDKQVTQIVLYIPNGTVLKNKTIYPMLNLGTAAEPYIMYEGNVATIDLENYTFKTGDNIKIENGTPILNNEIYINNDLYIGDDFIIGGNFYELSSIDMPKTYKNTTYFYTDKDTSLYVTYPNITQNLEYENTQSKNGGFSVDKEGNVSLKDALLNGGIIKIFDKSGQLLLKLDTNGQKFYDTNNNEIGTIGVVREGNQDTLAFAMNVDWDSVDESKSMAWGLFDKDGNFMPIFYLKGYYGAEDSEYGGELIIEGNLSTETLEVVKDTITTGGVGVNIINANGDIIFSAETATPFFNLANLIFSYISDGGKQCIDFSDCILTNMKNVPQTDENLNYISGSANSHIFASFKDGGSVIIFENSSDKNLKKNIKETSKTALDKIKKIKHKEFNWKSNNKHQDIGYIAQEIKEIDESFVHYTKYKDQYGEEKENWQINTLSVLATATKAIQEQDEEIEQLKEKDKQKNELIQSLMKRLEKLENQLMKGEKHEKS